MGGSSKAPTHTFLIERTLIMDERRNLAQPYVSQDNLEQYNKLLQARLENQSKAIHKIKDDYVTLTLIAKVLISIQVIELILLIAALAMIV